MERLSDDSEVLVAEKTACKQCHETSTDNKQVGRLKGHNKDSFMS
jgi:hypothetical protein